MTPTATTTQRHLVLKALFLLAVAATVALGLDEDHGAAEEERRLYESDNDKNCLEDEGCRFMLGLACLVLVPFLICWNEIKFVKLETLYSAAQRMVRDLDDHPNGDNNNNNNNNKKPTPPNDCLDGKFVCFSGRLGGETTLKDEIFPSIVIEKSLLLAREIEILQYISTKEEDKDPVLEQKWCKLPQKDPPHFKHLRNPIGNWNLFADPDRMVGTGDKTNDDGRAIVFGDNVTIVHRASQPTIGSFVLPTALMNEIFLGTRHVHRLGELELIKSSQGKWQYVNLDEKLNNNNNNPASPRPSGDPHWHLRWNPNQNQSSSTVKVKDGLQLPFACEKFGQYVYDGPFFRIGTIRIRWKYVVPQDLTVAAEAVAPGRPTDLGYGTNGTRNVSDHGVVFDMIKDDLTENCNNCCCLEEEGEKQGLLVNLESPAAAAVPSKHWTVTPFTVTTAASWISLLPFFDDRNHRKKILGKLWLYAPGLLDSNELFSRANRSNILCLWKVRGLSYLLLFLGWCLVFEPLSNTFRSIPILRGLLSLTFAAFAFVLASICCTSVALVARITARPIQSIMIISAIWATILYILQSMESLQPDDERGVEEAAASAYASSGTN